MKALFSVFNWLKRGAMMKLKANRWIAYGLVLAFASVSVMTIVLFPANEFRMPILTLVNFIPVAMGYWFLKHGPYEGPMFWGLALGVAIAVALSYQVIQDWTLLDALWRWCWEFFFSTGCAFLLIIFLLMVAGVPFIEFPADSCTCACPACRQRQRQV